MVNKSTTYSLKFLRYDLLVMDYDIVKKKIHIQCLFNLVFSYIFNTAILLKETNTVLNWSRPKKIYSMYLSVAI